MQREECVGPWHLIIPMMRIAMVSDAHLSGVDDPGQAALVKWLDCLEVDRLILLGDIFHHWWGFSGAVMDEYVPVCAALLRVRERGIDIDFVPGNHDFAAGPFFSERLGARVTGPRREQFDGVDFFLAHGDEADASMGYRLTRWVLRGWMFALLMRVLGPGLGGRLLRRLAGASRHHPANADELMRAQQDWAAERIAEGAQVVVMGHVHVPGVVARDGGTIVHLGDWVEHRTWLRVQDGQAVLFQAQPDGGCQPLIEVGRVP